MRHLGSLLFAGCTYSFYCRRWSNKYHRHDTGTPLLHVKHSASSNNSVSSGQKTFKTLYKKRSVPSLSNRHLSGHFFSAEPVNWPGVSDVWIQHVSYLYVFSGRYQACCLSHCTSAAACSHQTAGRFPGNKSGRSCLCRVCTFTSAAALPPPRPWGQLTMR